MFENPTTRVGTIQDRSTHWTYRPRPWTGLELEWFADAFCTDDLVNLIATRTPEEMLSRGFEIWQGPTRRHDIEQGLGPENLDLSGSLLQALVWERLLGGGGLLLGADDGREKESPLVESQVRKVYFLTPLERRDVLGNVRRDSHLTARFYRGQIRAHRSRFILFRAPPEPPRVESDARSGWGIGAVEHAWDEIRAFHASWADFRALLPDGSQGVLYIQGLTELLASEDGSKNLGTRVREIDLYKSILRTLVLDPDGEKYERVTTQLTGYSDAIARATERLAMAVREPLTVLLGTPPKGLNATGESDLTIYYDRIARERKSRVEPAVLKVARLVASSLGTDPAGLEVKWPPFWQPSASEEADRDAKVTGTAKTRIETARAALADGTITESEYRSISRAALGLEE